MSHASLLALRVKKSWYAGTHRLLWPALKAGVFPAADHAGLLARLQPAAVIDVGAHRGQFALVVKAECPEAVLVSFEPQSEACAFYRRVVPGDPDLRTLALGASDGEATLHISRASDSSSLLPIGSLQTNAFPHTGHLHDITVMVSTLDDQLVDTVLADPVLLKIDVQGAELEVLRGAGALLRRAQWVYVELSLVELYVGQPFATEVIGFLGVAGFDLREIRNLASAPDGSTIQGDFLFERTAAAASPAGGDGP